MVKPAKAGFSLHHNDLSRTPKRLGFPEKSMGIAAGGQSPAAVCGENQGMVGHSGRDRRPEHAPPRPTAHRDARQKKRGKFADKPGSVARRDHGCRRGAIIHLGALLPERSSSLPGSDASHVSTPLFGLAPDGVCRAGPVASPAVSSYLAAPSRRPKPRFRPISHRFTLA